MRTDMTSKQATLTERSSGGRPRVHGNGDKAPIKRASLNQDETIDRLAALFVAAGRWIEPRELDQLGGEATHLRMSLQRHGMRWAAAKQALLARHPNLLRDTGFVADDDTVMRTPAEVKVLNSILAMTPCPHVLTNVRLGDRAAYETDFLVDGRVLVEVAMVPKDTSSDNWLRRQYRERLGWKLNFYKWVIGRAPVIFWVEDILDEERLLARRGDITEILLAAPPRLVEIA